jgi:hypothetical protein
MSQKIIAAASHFALTGEILDTLLPLFSQRGHWFEDADNEGIDEDTLLLVINSAKLPVTRRMTTNLSGEPILLTSFGTYHLFPLNIVWREIKGELGVQNSPIFRAPHLRRVEGGVCLHLNSEFLAPSLEVIGTDLIADTPEIHLPRLNSAGAISARKAKSFSAPCLRGVRSDFFVPSATEINTPNLAFVGGNLNSESAPDFCPDNLAVMGSWTMHPAASARLAMRKRLLPP